MLFACKNFVFSTCFVPWDCCQGGGGLANNLMVHSFFFIPVPQLLPPPPPRTIFFDLEAAIIENQLFHMRNHVATGNVTQGPMTFVMLCFPWLVIKHMHLLGKTGTAPAASTSRNRIEGATVANTAPLPPSL